MARSWLREVIRDSAELVAGADGRAWADRHAGTAVGAGSALLGLGAAPPAEAPAPPPPAPSPWGYLGAAALGAAAVFVGVKIQGGRR